MRAFVVWLGFSSVVFAGCSLPEIVRREPGRDGGVTPGTDVGGVDDSAVSDDAADPGCVPDATRACYSGPAGTQGRGRCREGTQACDDTGAFAGSCVGEVVPASDETCGNGMDDDCDGMTDEDCGDCEPGTSRPCYAGASGTMGVGPCRAGTQFCNNTRMWSPDCLGQVLPATETCNNVDDNCDAMLDNVGSLVCGVGACRVTPPSCVAGAMQTCTPGTASTETCNRVDDDCDGTVDDGALCRVGTSCFAGACCVATGAACTATDACCLGSCLRGACACAANGTTCRAGQECCTGVCTLTRCACRALGARCTVSLECCSGTCGRGSCI